MKLLLDENMPVKIKQFFSQENQVITVSEKGWTGKQNGELLGLMTLHGVEGLVTLDKNLVYQQNIEKFEITVFILDAVNNKISTLKPFVKKVESFTTEKIKETVIEIKDS